MYDKYSMHDNFFLSYIINFYLRATIILNSSPPQVIFFPMYDMYDMYDKFEKFENYFSPDRCVFFYEFFEIYHTYHTYHTQKKI
jgi:hypothetical protein